VNNKQLAGGLEDIYYRLKGILDEVIQSNFSDQVPFIAPLEALRLETDLFIYKIDGSIRSENPDHQLMLQGKKVELPAPKIDKPEIAPRAVNVVSFPKKAVRSDGVQTAQKLVTDEMKEEMKRRYLNHEPIDTINREMGFHEGTVRRHLIKMGVHVDSQRLSPEVIADFGEMYVRGISVRQIAKKYQVAMGTVANHLARLGLREKAAKHVASDSHRGHQAALARNLRIRRE